MEPLETAVHEKVRLEKVWNKYRTLDTLGAIWTLLVAALLVFDLYSSFQPLRELSIGWLHLNYLLLLSGFLNLGFATFPSKRERETWAQLRVLEFQISGDVKKFAEELDSWRSLGYARLSENPTFRYWVPLYREFQRLGIDVPAPVEERFARLDRNRLNFFWAPVRRERQRVESKLSRG